MASVAAPAPNDIVHHLAFDTPGRPQLWRPVEGYVFVVEIRAPHIDESVFANHDRSQIKYLMDCCERLTRGRVQFAVSEEVDLAPNVWLDLYEDIVDMPGFRGGLLRPHVTPQGQMLGGVMEWTAWKHGYSLYMASGLQEFGHVLGLGHTDYREEPIAMGSGSAATVDYHPLEQAAMDYMFEQEVGALN